MIQMKCIILYNFFLVYNVATSNRIVSGLVAMSRKNNEYFFWTTNGQNNILVTHWIHCQIATKGSVNIKQQQQI